MFSDKIDVVYSQWPKVSEAILKEVNERKIQPNFETDLGKYFMLVDLNEIVILFS